MELQLLRVNPAGVCGCLPAERRTSWSSAQETWQLELPVQFSLLPGAQQMQAAAASCSCTSLVSTPQASACYPKNIQV